DGFSIDYLDVDTNKIKTALYSQLPKFLQQRFDSGQVTLRIYGDWSDDDIHVLFTRVNNTKPLKPDDKIKALDHSWNFELNKHPYVEALRKTLKPKTKKGDKRYFADVLVYIASLVLHREKFLYVAKNRAAVIDILPVHFPTEKLEHLWDIFNTLNIICKELLKKKDCVIINKVHLVTIADFLLMNITPLQEKKATLFAQIYDILINTAPLINQVTPLKFKLYQKIGNGKIKEFTDVT